MNQGGIKMNELHVTGAMKKSETCYNCYVDVETKKNSKGMSRTPAFVCRPNA
jgi:hypothetical protein